MSENICCWVVPKLATDLNWLDPATLLEAATLVNGVLISSLSFVEPELIVGALFRLPLAYISAF